MAEQQEINFGVGGSIVSQTGNLITEFKLKEVSVVFSIESIAGNLITGLKFEDSYPAPSTEEREEESEKWQRDVIEPTYEEVRLFGIHKKYGINPVKQKYIKQKVEGWRLVLIEGKNETTLPNMNDKPYAFLQSEKNKLIRSQTYPNGKLIIKPKI